MTVVARRNIILSRARGWSINLSRARGSAMSSAGVGGESQSALQWYYPWGPCQAHHMNMSYVSLIIHTCSVLHQISTPFKFRFLCVSLSSFCCYCICVLMCVLQPCLLLKCFASILCFGSCFHCFCYLAALFFSKICTYVCLYKIPFGLQWMQQICLGAYGPKVSKSMRTRVSLTRQRPFWTNLWLGSISCASSGNLFGDLSPTFPVPLQTSLHLLAQLRTMLCFLALLWTFPCPSAYTTDVYQLCPKVCILHTPCVIC